MKKGITSNKLKIIAIITMIIDHIGYYFYPILSSETYYLFRIIGRISMPIFAFLIIQGFFHTRNLKKYIFRILGLAIITQLCILFLKYINTIYFPNYFTGIDNYLNILFSYSLSLILLSVLNNKFATKYKIFFTILLLMLYLILPIDYGIRIPFIMLALYFIEKWNIKNNYKYKLKYILLILTAFALSLAFIKTNISLSISMLISVLFIAFYTGEKGNNNPVIQYAFYAFFPIHHIVLYLLAMCL